MPLKQLSKNDLRTYFKIEENFFFSLLIDLFGINIVKKKILSYQWNDSKKENIDKLRSDFMVAKNGQN